MEESAPAAPELVFGVVRPVGTSDEKFRTALRAALNRYAYSTTDIKLSGFLRDEAAGRGDELPDRDEEKRISALMDEGDALCARHRTGSAVALLGVAAIRRERAAVDTAAGIDPSDRPNIPLSRTAYLVDSLKRPAEITHLRRIYGDHFVVVSLQANIETRQDELRKKIGPGRPSVHRTMEKIVGDLVDRDLREADEFGQNTLRAFPMADVFIDLEGDVSAQVDRMIDLLFESPEYQPPTVPEFSMRLAETASTRSVELGLKVGASLVGADGTVLGLGHNAHPDPQHMPQFDPSMTDMVELIADTLSALPDGVLSDAAAAQLEADRDSFASDLLTGPLATSRLRDLIEFQRPVHAEMNALLAALRSRVDISDATMYVTAYPCHHCARHLLALGLRVIYLEPYPKSRAESMYGAAVGAFHPFTGVAPRRYADLFTVTSDRKDASGVRRQWGDPERAAAAPTLDPFVDPTGIAEREVSALDALAPERVSTPDPPSAKVSHPRKRVSKAGTGKAPPAVPARGRRQAAASSPTPPAPGSKLKGGRS